MAVVAILDAMHGTGSKNVHPFFNHNHADIQHHDERPRPEEAKPALDPAPVVHLDGTHDKPPKTKRSKKVDCAASGEGKGKKQKTIKELVNPLVAALQTPTEGIVSQATGHYTSEAVVDHARRKRRRTSEHESLDVGHRAPTPSEDCVPAPSFPRVIVARSSPPPDHTFRNELAHEETIGELKTRPKKVLKLNANGRLSSPLSKKTKPEEAQQASPGLGKRRGRPRKSKDATSAPRQLLIVIRYGHHEDGREMLGQRVQRILAGEERVATPADFKKPFPKKPTRVTHPFFTGKLNEPPPAPKQESPRKTSATTPGKLKRQVLGERFDRLLETREVPCAIGSDLLRDRHMMKHPGAVEPLWPDREQMHVRGGKKDVAQHAMSLQTHKVLVKERKKKAAQLPFPTEDTVLRHFVSNFVTEQDLVEREDGFYEPDPSLRLPEKLLICGREIRDRIIPELSVPMPDDAEDRPPRPISSQLTPHPMLMRMWTSIPNTLSAFDETRGEPLSWTQKYAPAAASEVLQPVREMTVLRDWLTSLVVTSVGSTGVLPPRHVEKVEVKPRKRRKRKPDDLKEFLVDSDDDIHTMDELTNPSGSPDIFAEKSLKSIVHMTSEGHKLSNAVLLSGPNGCGKTVAAYAVAKELGFKVFEIGSHERRSGKDVLDKVGNMTENHLVKHHGADVGDLSSAEEPNKEGLEEAFQRDLASGRQGKMNGFFKPKASRQAPVKQNAREKGQTLAKVQQAIGKPPKEQQQSLILLEEVDILFKDDKDFWHTVFKLIVTSKRPFIMTCNDEDLVPLQAMSLHAILRFSPPPLDLATDCMLLIAASEGHLLKRQAVSELYQSKRCDLRASIAELNLWCQMGVGDPRGGLSWIFQRWPPGSDTDKHGRRLRVVSNGTYQHGMGLPEITTNEEDKMLWVWREYGIEPTQLLSWNGTLPAVDGDASAVPARQRLRALKRYEVFAETLSSMDEFASIGLPETAPLDMRQPPLSDKARNQYIEASPVLQTDESIDYSGVSMQLVVATVRGLTSLDDNRRALAPPALCLDRLHSVLSPPGTEEQMAPLTRKAFACFDPISVPSDHTVLTNPAGLTQSSFDGPLRSIVTDLAPYVRSIVQYDLALAEHRSRLDSVMTDHKAKRARTTRAARSALEGSQRASTRKERWFDKGLDYGAVMSTSGTGWPRVNMGAAEDTASLDGSQTPASSAEGIRE